MIVNQGISPDLFFENSNAQETGERKIFRRAKHWVNCLDSLAQGSHFWNPNRLKPLLTAQLLVAVLDSALPSTAAHRYGFENVNHRDRADAVIREISAW